MAIDHIQSLKHLSGKLEVILKRGASGVLQRDNS
jgi:hypothetical protein